MPKPLIDTIQNERRRLIRRRLEHRELIARLRRMIARENEMHIIDFSARQLAKLGLQLQKAVEEEENLSVSLHSINTIRRSYLEEQAAKVNENAAANVHWGVVQAVLTTHRLIDEAKMEGRYTESLDAEDLDSFVYALCKEADKGVREGRIHVRVCG